MHAVLMSTTDILNFRMLGVVPYFPGVSFCVIAWGINGCMSFSSPPNFHSIYPRDIIDSWYLKHASRCTGTKQVWWCPNQYPVIVSQQPLLNTFPYYRASIKCYPQENSFTPCVNVLEKENWLRVCLWIVATVAVIGNLVVLIFTVMSRIRTKYPMSVTKFLICNLGEYDYC